MGRMNIRDVSTHRLREMLAATRQVAPQSQAAAILQAEIDRRNQLAKRRRRVKHV
ncbi:hypothetical protein PHYC_02200 [Phycisphaerales bacterium]|nr:hypothetical protein PHYC_02200 [Phycisphaerales bacterium]